jgi:hypothetical protein
MAFFAASQEERAARDSAEKAAQLKKANSPAVWGTAQFGFSAFSSCSNSMAFW